MRTDCAMVAGTCRSLPVLKSSAYKQYDELTRGGEFFCGGPRPCRHCVRVSWNTSGHAPRRHTWLAGLTLATRQTHGTAGGAFAEQHHHHSKGHGDACTANMAERRSHQPLHGPAPGARCAAPCAGGCLGAALTWTCGNGCISVLTGIRSAVSHRRRPRTVSGPVSKLPLFQHLLLQQALQGCWIRLCTGEPSSCSCMLLMHAGRAAAACLLQYGTPGNASRAPLRRVFTSLVQVRRWTIPQRLKMAGQASPSVLDCDLILVPVHQGMHWVCAIIDIAKRRFVYCDSLKVRQRFGVQTGSLRVCVEENPEWWVVDRRSRICCQATGSVSKALQLRCNLSTWICGLTTCQMYRGRITAVWSTWHAGCETNTRINDRSR